MTLFADGREANIKSTIAMVEDVLLELGHYVNQCRVEPDPDGQRAWQVKHGSAVIRIALGIREDSPHLRAVSIVLTLDNEVDQRALFRHLLELNRTVLCTVAFALDGPYVQLVAERPTLDLDRSEVFDLLRRIEHYADKYDDILVDTFGGTLGRAPS